MHQKTSKNTKNHVFWWFFKRCFKYQKWCLRYSKVSRGIPKGILQVQNHWNPFFNMLIDSHQEVLACTIWSTCSIDLEKSSKSRFWMTFSKYFQLSEIISEAQTKCVRDLRHRIEKLKHSRSQIGSILDQKTHQFEEDRETEFSGTF